MNKNYKNYKNPSFTMTTSNNDPNIVIHSENEKKNSVT